MVFDERSLTIKFCSPIPSIVAAETSMGKLRILTPDDRKMVTMLTFSPSGTSFQLTLKESSASLKSERLLESVRETIAEGVVGAGSMIVFFVGKGK